MHNDMIKQLHLIGLIPVIKIENPDDAVPLVSMVLFGSVAISSDAGNLSSDLQHTKLKWIEFGSLPTFELTEQSPTLLRDTDYNHLFTSENNKWSQTATEIYAEFAERLSSVSGAYMTDHETTDTGLVVLTYSNGTVVVLNYSDSDLTYETLTVNSKDYTVIEGEG